MALHESVRFFAATDVGRVRTHNEDNFLIDKRLGLFVVADGMGGHAAGEVASALAVRTIHEEVKRHRAVIEAFEASGGVEGGAVDPRQLLLLLERAVQRASARIHEESRADTRKRGMGTTTSALLLVGSLAFIAHVGDSRVYMQRGDSVQQITEDHTVYNELLHRKKLSRAQIEKVAQKNAITRALGIYERAEVDTLLIEAVPGDVFLICSDGLHGYAPSDATLLAAMAHESDAGVRELIDFANERGGKDNITALIVRLGAMNTEDAMRTARQARKREVIQRMPLFSKLSPRELLRVMSVTSVRVFPHGHEVLREGDRGDALLIVLSGRLEVWRGEARVALLGPGEHVGELALVRSASRPERVVAEGSTEVIVLERADFFEILRKEHELAVKLLWQLAGALADRLDLISRALDSARAAPPSEALSDAEDLDLDEDLMSPPDEPT